jgi:hypothetical protein
MEGEWKMSKKFEDLLTAYMVARDYVETENRKYGLFEEKPTLDMAINELREARRELLAYVAELEAENAELRPYRDGYDPLVDVPKDTKTVIVEIKAGLVLGVYDTASKRWYATQGLQSEIRNPIRWWELPEVER